MRGLSWERRRPFSVKQRCRQHRPPSPKLAALIGAAVSRTVALFFEPDPITKGPGEVVPALYSADVEARRLAAHCEISHR
jgi:hypothetical protein